MVKKSLCVCFLFAFFGSSFVLSQYKVDLLNYHAMNWTEAPPDWFPEDPYSETTYDTGTLINLKVPPCPKSRAIAFEVYAASSFEESMETPYLTLIWACQMKIVSNIIPENIEVSQAMWVGNADSPQDGYRPVLISPIQRRVAKSLIKRNEPSWWSVFYKDTRQDIPNDEAIKILNKLMDKGFSIEFSLNGTLQGIKRVSLCVIAVFISSIS